MIRVASEKDIESINKLGKLFSHNFLNTYDIKEYLKNSLYIILVNDDKYINSFIIVYKNIDYFELEAIVVDTKLRKQGIANNMIEYFLDNYTKKNDEILLEVAVNNEAAINLYKKFNFEIISTRKKYYDGIDAYIMKKVI